MHPQNLMERLMPHAQFEARERVRQARRERGVDSDEATVQDKDKDGGDNGDDPQEEAAPLEARICETTVDMFKRVLLFSQGAVEALYDDQMIMTLDVHHDLTNDIIKELCRAISRGSTRSVPAIFFPSPKRTKRQVPRHSQVLLP
jgi:hypothetical protein